MILHNIMILLGDVDTIRTDPASSHCTAKLYGGIHGDRGVHICVYVKCLYCLGGGAAEEWNSV